MPLPIRRRPAQSRHLGEIATLLHDAHVVPDEAHVVPDEATEAS